MKTEKFALLFVALMLGTIVLFAQRGFAGRPGPGYGPGYAPGNGPGYGPGSCMMFLQGLTDDQRTKMVEMETNHQKEMVEFRVKQRSTFDPEEKVAIWGEMQKKVLDHRSAVRNLLTEEQQKQYDLLRGNNFYGRGRFAPGCRARGGRATFGRRGGGFGGYRGGWQ